MTEFITKNLTMVKGDTKSFGFELSDSESSAITLETAYFSCKKNFEDTDYVFQKSLNNGITASTNNKFIVRIAPNDTVLLEPGQYYYDLEIGVNSDIFTIMRGILEILPQITEPNAIVYESVPWGNITGTLSNQTDLQTALNTKANTSALAQVATTGSYTDLLNTPSIPSKTSDLTNDNNFISSESLATVATSGKYSDLLQRPTQLSDFGGILPVTNGGTGATTADAAKENLGIEKQTVLYSGSASSGTIELSDSIMNYSKIGISFYDTRQTAHVGYSEILIFQSITMYQFLAKLVFPSSDTNLCIRAAIFSIDETTLVIERNRTFNINESGVSSNDDNISIKKIIGFN